MTRKELRWIPPAISAQIVPWGSLGSKVLRVLFGEWYKFFILVTGFPSPCMMWFIMRQTKVSWHRSFLSWRRSVPPPTHRRCQYRGTFRKRPCNLDVRLTGSGCLREISHNGQLDWRTNQSGFWWWLRDWVSSTAGLQHSRRVFIISIIVLWK